MSERDGDPAFPNERYDGMSLRDWLAGQALTGLMAYPHDMSPDEAAASAYRYADAMLAERAKP